MSATVCPACNRALPASVVNGPAQAVVRCEGCQTLLLWSNGRVMRSAKSSTGTMMGLPAVTGAVKREADAPLPELKPEADAAPGAPPQPKGAPPRTPAPKAAPPRTPAPKTPPPRTATQPVAKVAQKRPTVMGIGDQVPTAAPNKTAPSGPVKLPPPATAAATGSARGEAPRAEAPKAAAPKAEAPKAETGEPGARQVVAAVAQVPNMGGGEMVDPSAWFAGGVSEVVGPESVPAVESGKPGRADPTGAAPLPPPPSLPPLEVEPFEIEAPGSDKTPAIGPLMPEARSGPIAVRRGEPSQKIATREPSQKIATREPSQKISTCEPSQKISTREPSQKIATGAAAAKKDASSIRGAEPQPPPLRPLPDAPPRATVMGRPAPELPRPPEVAGRPGALAPAAPPPLTRQPVAPEPLDAAAAFDGTDATPVKAHAALSPPVAAGEPRSAEPPPTAVAAAAAATAAGMAARGEPTAETSLPQPETMRVPLQVSRRVLFIVAGAAAGVVVLVFVVIAMSHGDKKAKPAVPVSRSAPSLPPPAAVEPPKPTPVEPAPAPTPPAPTNPTPTTAAGPATVTPPADATETAPPRPRHTLGGKKVVLEYDPKPTSPAPPAAQAPTPRGEDPATLARAREAYHKGNVKLFAGDDDAAIALYQESLKIYPGYVAGYRGLGLAFEVAGKNEQALKAFHTYVRTVPNAVDASIIRRRIDHLESAKP
jgi:carnitine O-acetyltransferase